jgi:hypothetical protein
MAFAPIFLKDCVLSLGGTEFQAEVSSAAFTPSTTSAVWKGLTPTSRHTATATDWNLDLSVGQDYDTAASLSRYLLEHAGETVEGQLTPKDGGQGYSANVAIAPVAIGGPVETFAEGTVSMPCDAPVALT